MRRKEDQCLIEKVPVERSYITSLRAIAEDRSTRVLKVLMFSGRIDQ